MKEKIARGKILHFENDRLVKIGYVPCARGVRSEL
jgi:hypothetical protein